MIAAEQTAIDEIASKLFAEADDLAMASFGAGRPLAPEDLLRHVQEGVERTGAAEIVHLRARHHHMARLLAIGIPEIRVCEIVGTSPMALSALKKSSAFRELLDAYMADADQDALDLHEQIHHVAGLALDSIRKDLTEKEDQLTFDAKRGILRDMLSFSGYQQASKNINHNHRLSGGFSREELAEIKSPPRIVDAEVVHEQERGEGARAAGSLSPALPGLGSEGGGSGIGGAAQGLGVPAAHDAPAKHDAEAAGGESV